MLSTKRFIKLFLLKSGYYYRILKQAEFPGVAVLCYHGVKQAGKKKARFFFSALHVKEEELDAHCRLISEFCNPISLDDWRDAVNKKKKLPSRPVLFTFDDGYRNVFTLAKPILMKYHIPAVFFVSTYPVKNNSYLWFDALASVLGEKKITELKDMKPASLMELYHKSPFKTELLDSHACMTPGQIKELSSIQGFELGCHTSRHIILSKASREEQAEEIKEAKLMLEEWVQKKVRAFAYPNGRPQLDYTEESVSILKEQDFDFGFTTKSGFAGIYGDTMEEPRFIMLEGVSEAELAHRLCFSWQMGKNIKK
ncbi:MAG: polysaccharide deacetylase family protein [Candidatus Omnitrophota bacterium]|jgi:peptidoglycan/xylan/chitin deacetylase (PgdA/CDA1 family)|nr:MAG: polysaccharide deacetylase family protein [Candidatus Omnitrophota bacterium]